MSTPAPLILRTSDPTGRQSLAPAYLHTVKKRLIARPAGDEAATEQTIGLMRALAVADSHSAVVKAAVDVAGQGAVTEESLVERIWQWVKRRVRYLEDEKIARLAGVPSPDDTEVLIRPAELLRLPHPAGDCDDHAMLVAAMLTSAGVRASFKAIEADPRFPGAYSHVYVIAHTPSGPVALDTSHGPACGWEAPRAPGSKARVWSVPMVQDATEAAQLGAVAPWVQDLIKTGVNTTSSILQTRLGQPPAGVYTQGADGSVYYRQQPGSGPLAYPGVGVGVGGSFPSWLVLAAIGVVGLAIIASGSKRK